jgi:DNA-binding GntR family transcriptional regulator
MLMADPAVTYQQQAYDFVKNQIMTLRYKPGQDLTDSQVAQDLHISRTPVREAFHRLENEGLLINESPRRGWRVYTLSLEDIHEIFDIKEVVEGLIARQAARCDDAARQDALRDAMRRMRDAREKEDLDHWLSADMALHDAIFCMAPNERGQRIVANLNDQWHRVRIGFMAMQGRIVRSTDEHEGIVDAILAQDGDAAEQRMRQHLNAVREELVRLLVTLVLPFVENGV